MSASENQITGSSPLLTATLQREAYYHFFLEDYLTSATRLKMLTGSTANDTERLNEVRLLLGSLYLAWGMHRPATIMFDKLVTVFPPGHDRNRVLLLIERLQYSRSLYQAAVDTYERLTPDPAFPSRDQAGYLAGMSHYGLGDFENVLRVLTMVPRASGYAPFAKLASAKSHLQLQDATESIRLLKELGAMEAGEDLVLRALAEKSRLTLGLLLTEIGQYDQALEPLSSIPAASRFYADALFGLGWAHFYAEHYLESLLTFGHLIQTTPEHTYALEALTTVGHCYDRLGDRQGALLAYGEALDTYQQEGQHVEGIRTLIRNRDRLDDLLRHFDAVLDSPLAGLLEDDGLRFWIKQYGELSSLEKYLDQKLGDMGVFGVMVDHREAVFRDRLPTIQRFLQQSPVTPLREQEQHLHRDLEQAVERETVEALASGEEATTLNALREATHRSRALGKSIEQLKGRSPTVIEQSELESQWKAADRWLGVFRGELRWKIITEVPGRSDDLQRTANHLQQELETLEHEQRTLMQSVPALEGAITQFRRRIQETRRDLLDRRVQLIELRKQLLPPLQSLLLKALDHRTGRLEALAATARLSQIRILDFTSQ
jgi:tetratricopeptide (TPR) repeat protein